MRSIMMPSKVELQAKIQTNEHKALLVVGQLFDLDALAYLDEYGPVAHGTLYGKFRHDYEMQAAFHRLKRRGLAIPTRDGRGNYSYALTKQGKEVLDFIRQTSQKGRKAYRD